MSGPGMDWDTVQDIFTFHAPPNDQTRTAHEAVRDACKFAAGELLMVTPSSPEQTLAIRKLQEAMMYANAAIALHGVPNPHPSMSHPSDSPHPQPY